MLLHNSRILHLRRHTITARPRLLIQLLHPIPLLAVRDLLLLLGCQLRDVVLNLLGQDEVEDQRREGDYREPGFEDQLDGVVEAGERAIIAAVGEDVGEPAVRC